MNTNPAANHAAFTHPLVREFAMYIKGKFHAQMPAPAQASMSDETFGDAEEAIMTRMFFYRILRIALLRNLPAGSSRDAHGDFISTTTAYQWARLDAQDFRNMYRHDGGLCVHGASIICASPSSAYKKALQYTAPDVLESAYAAVRGKRAMRQPGPPSPVPDGQGVLPLLPPAPDAGVQRGSPVLHFRPR